jgi:hypothetical protein
LLAKRAALVAIMPSFATARPTKALSFWHEANGATKARGAPGAPQFEGGDGERRVRVEAEGRPH